MHSKFSSIFSSGSLILENIGTNFEKNVIKCSHQVFIVLVFRYSSNLMLIIHSLGHKISENVWTWDFFKREKFSFQNYLMSVATIFGLSGVIFCTDCCVGARSAPTQQPIQDSTHENSKIFAALTKQFWNENFSRSNKIWCPQIFTDFVIRPVTY